MSVVLHSIELIVWLLMQPSKWRHHLKDIHNEIPNNFALVDLRWLHWKIPKLYTTLIATYLFIPCIVLVTTLPLSAIQHGEIRGSLIGYFFVYILGLCIGIYVSVAGSILFLSIAGVVVVFQWGGSDALMFDFTSGLNAGVLFGGCAACLIVAAINQGDNSSSQSAARQIGAVILGLAISLPLVVAVTYTVFTVTAGRQSGALHGSWLIWTMVLPPIILSIATVYLKTRSVLKTILPALFCFIIFSAGFGDMGYEYDVSVGGFTLLAAIMSVIISTFCMLSFFPSVLVLPLVGDLPAMVTGAVGGLAIHLGLKISFTYYPFYQNLAISVAMILLAVLYRHVWSLLSYPFQAVWNRLLLELDMRQNVSNRYFPGHSLCWDEIQLLPFFELDEYLVKCSEKSKKDGDRYINLVNQTNQKWAAQAALTELDARRLETLPDVTGLANTQSDESAGLLPTSAGMILRRFSQVSQDISAAMEQPSRFNQILVLRTVAKDLDQLQLELNRNYKDKVAIRFVTVAEHWRQLVIEYTNSLDRKSKTNKEIPNPYTVGVPLTRRQKIFVGRTDIARFLEDVLNLQDHPPLLLYGPRRMGKTSLLFQLHWMLPRTILTLIVDLQGPVGLAQSHSGFVFALARAINRAAAKQHIQLTNLSRSALDEDPFTKFDEWLNTIETEMLHQGCSTLLLALDEFEALDIALRERTLRDHAVLGMLRHIAQHRTRIKLMLVGSHTLGEFKRWSTYFVNAQVIELSYLSNNETRQLIEQPIADFPLHFLTGATDRIIQFTRGHPYLVQLTCAELIALKNGHPVEQRQLVTIKDIEACIPLTLQRGQQFFTDIELNQMDDLGRECLLQLASFGQDGASELQLGTVFPDSQLKDTLATLEQRSIIERSNNKYHFQVEAVARWFASVI